MYDNEYISQLTLKKKLLLIFFGTILFTLAIFICLSSFSFNFNDTGWQSVSNLETGNIFGQYVINLFDCIDDSSYTRSLLSLPKKIIQTPTK